MGAAERRGVATSAPVVAPGTVNAMNENDVNPVWSEPVLVELSRLAPGPWQRPLDQTHVDAFAQVIEQVEPIQLTHDARIIDGRHRVAAALQSGKTHLLAHCASELGSTAVVMIALTANSSHGLPLTRQQRLDGARQLLEMTPTPSVHQVAQACGLARRTVSAISRQLRTGTPTGPGTQLATPAGPPHGDCVCRTRMSSLPRCVGRDGRSRPVDVGAQQAVVDDAVERHDEWSTAQLVEHLGVSPATVIAARRRLMAGAVSRATLRTPWWARAWLWLTRWLRRMSSNE